MASCLDSPVRRHTFMTSKTFFLKNWPRPQTPTLTCAQNLFVKITFVNWKINPFQSECFQEDIEKQRLQRFKGRFIPMKFCLFDACFLIIYISLFITRSLPTIITTSGNFVSTNQCCLCKQFKDVYDSDTVVLHGIIPKSNEVNVQFSTRTMSWIPFQVLFKGFVQVFQCFLWFFRSAG